MQPKVAMIIVGVLVVLGIGGGIYLNTNRPDDPSANPNNSQATPNEAPTESSLSQGTTDAQATKEQTNMQNGQNADLSTDKDGMSKVTGTIVTKYGPIKFKFYPKEAPKTVARMVELIQSGFYNGLTFHRVEKNFVVQGGDPNGNGTGGSGQKLKAEFNRRRHQEGTLAMARAMDPDSADSQFYITFGPQPHLDDNYTVFGQVIEGMDAVRQIKPGDAMEKVSLQN